jgi:hypothetical protein
MRKLEALAKKERREARRKAREELKLDYAYRRMADLKEY